MNCIEYTAPYDGMVIKYNWDANNLKKINTIATFTHRYWWKVWELCSFLPFDILTVWSASQMQFRCFNPRFEMRYGIKENYNLPHNNRAQAFNLDVISICPNEANSKIKMGSKTKRNKINSTKFRQIWETWKVQYFGMWRPVIW